MKPAGPERDREIAEVRGFTVREVNVRGKFQYCIPRGPAGYGRGYPRCPVPKWSTDIAAAMELWEEMKNGRGDSIPLKKRVISVRLEYNIGYASHPDGIIGVRIVMPGDESDVINYRGKTEADAISGAYLKWKGFTF
jgi:hypothetical protein